jgi:hypothetical protein
VGFGHDYFPPVSVESFPAWSALYLLRGSRATEQNLTRERPVNKVADREA